MEKSTPARPPSAWGNDKLTDYLDNVRGNQFATFANKRSEVIDLISIDKMFLRFLDGAINPKPFFPMGFLTRAHSAFRSATGAVMAGQIYESQTVLRVCLEQGAYAHYVGDDEARWECWIHRHDSDSSKTAMRKEFTNRKVVNHLVLANRDLGETYQTLYDRTIDYGAHPNERGASLGSKLVDTEDGGKQFLSIYLHEDGLMLDFGLRSAAQVGLWVLRVAHDIYPTRFQALALKHQIQDISRRF